MFNYYHIYPTCPCCLEPNLTGISVVNSTPDDFCKGCGTCSNDDCKWGIFQDKVNNNTFYKCNACGAVFYRNIELSCFEKTQEFIRGLEEINYKIPFIWEIQLNEIEKDYINWIDELKGKFFITWPWEEVKFIPIFITEYVSGNPDKKIVIVDNFYQYGATEEFLKPNSLDIFEYLLYSSSKTPLSLDLKKEYKKFSNEHVFKKLKMFHYMLNYKSNNRRYISPQKFFFKYHKVKTLRGYNTQIIKELEDVHGEKCIFENYVENQIIDDNSNDDGFIVLKVIEEKDKLTATSTKFNNSKLWENIVNINNFNRVKNDFDYRLIQNENDLNYSDSSQIFFVSEDLDNLFNIIEDINPNLVLFPNVDKFVKDSMYNETIRSNFEYFLDTTLSDCLLFSTDKDARHLYKKYDFLINDIPLHTWDNDLILSQIPIEDNSIKTAGSSSFEDLEYFSSDLCFHKVDELNHFEELINKTNKKMKNKSYNEYFFRLLRSPLPARSKDKYLQLYNKYVNFESILYEMRNYDSELFNDLYQIYESYYGYEENPIFSKILEVVINQLNDIDVKKVIIILSSDIEIKKFKKMLDYKDNDLLNIIDILTWDELNKMSNVEEKSVIISMSYPKISYKLYNSKIKRFIFIGSNKYLNEIKKTVKKRVDTAHCRPVDYKDFIDYPPLLKNVLKSSGIKDMEEDKEYFFEDELEVEETEYYDSTDVDLISKKNTSISKNSHALLLLDEDSNGLFIPTKYRVMFKHPRYVVDVLDIKKEKDISKLRNKEIILNKSHFMISYKDIFFKFVVDEGDGIKIIQDSYEWENFYQLINSVFDWRNELGNCLTLMSENDLSSNALDELTLELSNSGTFASTESHIKNNWLSDSMKYTIKTKYGNLNLYDIEMPMSKTKDLMEIFAVIKNHNESINVEERAYKNYAAYKHIIKMRDSFLNHNKINPKYKHLHIKFLKDLEQIIKRQDSFKVKYIKKVKLTESVIPFKKIRNFQDYIEE